LVSQKLQYVLLDVVGRHLTEVNDPDNAMAVDENPVRKADGYPVGLGDLPVGSTAGPK